MPLTLSTILQSENIDPERCLMIRHVFTSFDQSVGTAGLSVDADDEEILTYTSRQSINPAKFPADPPETWVVFIGESGKRARLWSVLDFQGETHRDDMRCYFNLSRSPRLAELQNRLVIHWNSPLAWKVNGKVASTYPVLEIADRTTEPFPGFEHLAISYHQLQEVVTEHRYASWQTALRAVHGIYLITDLSDGRHYVGKADGAESILQRWRSYAATGHGGNVELINRDPKHFRFSLLRVFDKATPMTDVNAAEKHFKHALATWELGLNKN